VRGLRKLSRAYNASLLVTLVESRLSLKSSGKAAGVEIVYAKGESRRAQWQFAPRGYEIYAGERRNGDQGWLVFLAVEDRQNPLASFRFQQRKVYLGSPLRAKIPPARQIVFSYFWRFFRSTA
jgi:hypothetical protein